MKQTNLVMFIMLLITSKNFSQVFEGKIMYSIAYKSKMNITSSEQLTLLLGSKQAYVI